MEQQQTKENTNQKTDKNFEIQDIQGLGIIQQHLMESIVMPLKFPQIFVEIYYPKVILIHGPQIQQKSLQIAKACAKDSNSTLYPIQVSEIVSQNIGKTGEKMKSIFQDIKQKQPCILFINNFEQLSSQQQGINDLNILKTEFLVQLQEIHKNSIIILLASTQPWNVEPLLRRRLDKIYYIQLPDKTQRQQILQHQLKSLPHNLQIEDLEYISQQTENYSEEELQELINNTYQLIDSNQMQQENQENESLQQEDLKVESSKAKQISLDNIKEQLKQINPKTQKQELEKFKQFNETFGNHM